MQYELNTFSLAIALTLVTLSMTLILVMAAYPSGSEQSLRHWALGNVALTLGILLHISQGLAPHSLAEIAASGLMLLGLGVVWLGVRAFKGLHQPQSGPILFALVLMVALGYFHYIDDRNDMRLLFTGYALGSLCLLSASELLIAVEAPLRRTYWFTGSIMLLSGMGLWLAAVLSSRASLTDLTAASSALQQATLLGTIMAQTAIAGGFILMSHSRTIKALQSVSEHDGLTGTLNRRSMHKQAKALLSHACEQGRPMSVVMLDADHFKRINDEFGHQIGDAVLCHMVSRIRTHLRSHDLLGRYGGEEFVLVLPGLDASQAREVAERIRLAVSDHARQCTDHRVALSISLGIAGTGVHGYDYNTLVAAADNALYRAKALGRNRVEVCLEHDSLMRDQMALRLLSEFSHNLEV